MEVDIIHSFIQSNSNTHKEEKKIISKEQKKKNSLKNTFPCVLQSNLEIEKKNHSTIPFRLHNIATTKKS
jgi:hypothetical protein